MMKEKVSIDNNTQAFFELVRAGLWEKEARLAPYGVVDFSEVLRLATEQSVVGLVAAGLEHVSDMKVPQERALQFVGQTLQIEQRNKAMNAFVAELIERLRKADIYAILVKGQGIAQCYEKPLWRASGDVDLLLNEENYLKAADNLKSIATSVDEENPHNKHLAMTIDGWSVEMHGTLRSGLWKGLDEELDMVMEVVSLGEEKRSMEFYDSKGAKVQIHLPAPDEDVIFVFSHILQHFFMEGIGLRQICDWYRLLWTYRELLNQELLEQRIKKAGVMTEWKAFYMLAIKYLGMPEEVSCFMFQDARSEKWEKKANKVMAFVLETGNFGHNRDYSYYKKYPYLIYKVISLCHHIRDTYRYSLIFPLDSLRVMWSRLRAGVGMVASGK